jgi:hypothetical protein
VPQKLISSSLSLYTRRPRTRHQHILVTVATSQPRLIMVRVKYRYLVVNFLYPEPLAKGKTPLPDLVQIHSPTPDAFHGGVLVRMIREGVEDVYGDYGSAMVSTGLKGASYSPSNIPTITHIQQSITGLPPLPPPLFAAHATTTKWYGPRSHMSHIYQTQPIYRLS